MLTDHESWVDSLYVFTALNNINQLLGSELIIHAWLRELINPWGNEKTPAFVLNELNHTQRWENIRTWTFHLSPSEFNIRCFLHNLRKTVSEIIAFIYHIMMNSYRNHKRTSWCPLHPSTLLRWRKKQLKKRFNTKKMKRTKKTRLLSF